MKEVSTTTAYYPVFLKIRDRSCAVIGGGQVALRKVKQLLESEAKVTVISPEFCPELVRLAAQGEISLTERRYRTGDLRGVFVAIAATNDTIVNQRIAEEGRKESVLVNVVDDADDSDFIVPSLGRRGDITIAVSTSGKSPALARKIRTMLEEQFGEEYASLALLVSQVRTEIRQTGIPVSSERWQEALDVDSLLELLRKQETDKAKAVLLANLRKGGH
ncbi:MAG: bifunctional precorrin-2 dehydrogenase/sirohydrochlorin ferrochelatase [Chloroflexi bacterium]|nr:bifunctional precorrin-2 dehydrogenase/sirohydrochlorin ferrochelatase [Chloroflexota bacterium]